MLLHRWGWCFLLIAFGGQILASQGQSEYSAPPLLTFSELRALALTDPPTAAVKAKLQHLLNTPFVHNRATSEGSKDSAASGLRVAFWNIERGLEWESIADAFANGSDYLTRLIPKKRMSEREQKRALAELAELRRADIIILNEVDLGMKRTRYADVAQELAKATGMNYAFGVEFVEVDRLYTGDEQIEMETPERTKALSEDLRADSERYLGLHGNAVLSRFPIRSARILRLTECYDWFGEEMDGIAALEKGRRWAAEKVFSERMTRQLRRGGRMSLVVELDAGGPQPLTVVSTHLEDRARSACRREQMAEVLDQVREVGGPVIIGGDLNSSATDGTRRSVMYEIRSRVSDPSFWTKQGIRWLTPVSIPSLLAFPLNLWKNHHDPTVMHIPLVGPNEGRRSSNQLRNFRFSDGGRIDFSGDRTRSGNGRGRTLANSNQRSWKGFHPTYHMERTYFIAGTYKLDWLLVKESASSTGTVQCRPRNPMTLSRFNNAGGRRLSDHHPITVDVECAAVPAASARVAP